MMRSSNGIGLGLSLVFGCLLLALVVELFYMLWWKKKRVVLQSLQTQHQEHLQVVDGEDTQSSSARYFLCCKNALSLSSCGALNPRRICASVRFRESQLQRQLSSNKSEDVFLWQTGPPRYLFTIKEETVEDLESEDAKSAKSRKASTSLNELLLRVESHTPYLTPIPSPPITSPTIHDYRFNPFLESSTDVEISKINSSPPPKFSFLLAAEDKFRRKIFMEEEHSKDVTFSRDSSIAIV